MLNRNTHLLHRPERGLCLLVHLPDVGVLNGENYEPSGILSKQRFFLCIETVLVVTIFMFEAILQRTRAQ